MLVGILKKLVGIMIGPVGILKNACRYFETVGIMNVGIMNATRCHGSTRQMTQNSYFFYALTYYDAFVEQAEAGN